MKDSAVQNQVAKLNESLGGKPPTKEKPEKPAPAKQPKAQAPTESIPLEIPLKNGAPHLPSSMIRVELGYYDKPTEKETGFKQIGVAVVYFGIPVPVGKGKSVFHPVSWQDQKVEVKLGEDGKTIEEVRLIGPLWTKKNGSEDDNQIYAAASLGSMRDRICRTILGIIREGKMRPVGEIWSERREYRAVYDYKTTPRSLESAFPLEE